MEDAKWKWQKVSKDGEKVEVRRKRHSCRHGEIKSSSPGFSALLDSWFLGKKSTMYLKAFTSPGKDGMKVLPVPPEVLGKKIKVYKHIFPKQNDTIVATKIC